MSTFVDGTVAGYYTSLHTAVSISMNNENTSDNQMTDVSDLLESTDQKASQF